MGNQTQLFKKKSLKNRLNPFVIESQKEDDWGTGSRILEERGKSGGRILSRIPVQVTGLVPSPEGAKDSSLRK